MTRAVEVDVDLFVPPESQEKARKLRYGHLNWSVIFARARDNSPPIQPDVIRIVSMSQRIDQWPSEIALGIAVCENEEAEVLRLHFSVLYSGLPRKL